MIQLSEKGRREFAQDETRSGAEVGSADGPEVEGFESDGPAVRLAAARPVAADLPLALADSIFPPAFCGVAQLPTPASTEEA
jgi:hypothetical protein